MPPKVLTRNGDRAGGVLPVPASARTASAAKPPAIRLKLEIRRLPPGLTSAEFEEVLGEEWKLGNGKVDWREYRAGKMKTALGKYPEQSRCYLHLVDEAAVKQLEARFLTVEFLDKAGTHASPDLRHLPPTIGFALNQRTTLTTKIKTDPRQGTIDQDPEFIAFLEAETQPLTKATALDSVNVEKEKTEKVEVKSTPLIEALREKKALKEKARLAKEDHKKDGKGHNKNESKDSKTAEKATKGTKDSKDPKSQPQHEVLSKDTTKAGHKQSAGKQIQQSGQKAAATSDQPSSQLKAQNKAAASPAKSKRSNQGQKTTTDAQNSTSTPAAASATTAASTNTAPTPSRGSRQRGNTDGIKKMLQKDLGIKAKTDTAAPASGNANTPAKSSPSTANGSNISTPNKVARQTASTPKQSQSTATTAVSPAPTAAPVLKAYLKHANPSQGMTEILIQQALTQYGEVTNVTIDPRKGTAIAIFKDSEGLAKALEAKKVPVANGTVEVLVFRSTGGGAGGSGSGGGNSGGGRGNAKGGRGGGGRNAKGGNGGNGGGGGGGGSGGGNAGGGSSGGGTAQAAAPAAVPTSTPKPDATTTTT